MWATILSALGDSLLKGLFGLISQELEKRGLIAQGKAEQRAADLQATVTESTDAAKIREQVQVMPDAALDADLERLRRQPGLARE